MPTTIRQIILSTGKDKITEQVKMKCYERFGCEYKIAEYAIKVTQQKSVRPIIERSWHGMAIHDVWVKWMSSSLSPVNHCDKSQLWVPVSSCMWKKAVSAVL